MANFTLTPDICEAIEPDYNVLETVSDGYQKQYQLLGGPIQRFKLIWHAMNSADYHTLLSHFAGQYGGYSSFSWTGVPVYIDTNLDGTPDGSNMTGRWVRRSFRSRPLPDLPGKWYAEIIFEKEL